MKIIIEGPDASGKSTLIAALYDVLDRAYIALGEGPEKYEGEIRDRINRLDNLNFNGHVIYDRHPRVSENIYRVFRGKPPLDPDLLVWPSSYRHFLKIYCQPRGLELTDEHRVRDPESVDTPQHLEMIKKNHSGIVEAYERWAMAEADLLYRSYEPEALERMVRLVAYRCIPETFHKGKNHEGL